MKLMKMMEDRECTQANQTMSDFEFEEHKEMVKSIKFKQEEVIKTIVLNQAMSDVISYQKQGEYKEQLIRSIVNKSGVFVKEFREISDPYTREEFIMSLNVKGANFGIVT